MIINTKKIRKYLKVIQSIREKGHDQYSNLYLNFETKEILFQNSSLVFGKIRLEYTGEIEKNLYVPSDKFLHLVNMYDEIELRDNIFYGNDSKYTLLYYDGEVSFPDLKTPERMITITKELYSNFKNASAYIDDDPYSALHGLFVVDNRIIATNRIKLYDYKLSEDCGDLRVPYPVVKILDLIGSDKQISLVKEVGDTVIVTADDDLVIWQSVDLSLDPPKINDPGFIKRYNHKEFMEVDRKKLLEELLVLNPFLEYQPNNRILFKFESEESLKLIINSSADTVDFANVEKIFTGITYSDFNYFKDRSILLSARDLKDALSHTTLDKIKIRVSFETYTIVKENGEEVEKEIPAFDVYQNENFHIILTKIGV